MRQYIKGEHQTEGGNPAGGHTTGTGIDIQWQNGPLAIDGERRPPNGAFVEGVIEAAIDRLQYYQESKFACEENGHALVLLDQALRWLNKRTEDREKRGVEGTHAV